MKSIVIVLSFFLGFPAHSSHLYSDHMFRTQIATLGGFKYSISVVAPTAEAANGKLQRTGPSHIVLDQRKLTGRSLRETEFPCNDMIKAEQHPVHLSAPLITGDRIYVAAIFASPSDLTGKYRANQFRLFELVSGTEVAIEPRAWVDFSKFRYFWQPDRGTLNDNWVMDHLFFDLTERPKGFRLTAKFQQVTYEDVPGNEVILERDETPLADRYEYVDVPGGSWDLLKNAENLQARTCSDTLKLAP
jgi:hypothetical protein